MFTFSLARTKNADLCRSIGAEIIPHFRPPLWVQIYYAEHYEELKRHPLRLKGHLFFDASHHPCEDPNMTDRDPLRRSDWEIHPVYSIDVCSNTSLSGCSTAWCACACVTERTGLFENSKELKRWECILDSRDRLSKPSAKTKTVERAMEVSPSRSRLSKPANRYEVLKTKIHTWLSDRFEIANASRRYETKPFITLSELV